MDPLPRPGDICLGNMLDPFDPRNLGCLDHAVADLETTRCVNPTMDVFGDPANRMPALLIGRAEYEAENEPMQPRWIDSTVNARSGPGSTKRA